MDRRLKSIDIAQISVEKKLAYYLEGWVIWEGEEKLALTVTGDGQEEIACTSLWKERPDIREVCKDICVPDTPGFSVYIPDIKRWAGNYRSIQLWAICREDRELLFETDTEAVCREYAEKSIAGRVDVLDLYGDIMTIQGWMVDCDSEENGEIILREEDGTQISCRCEREIRLDVNKNLRIGNSRCESGFNISLRREKIKGKVLHICFCSRNVFREQMVDMAEFDYEHSPRGRLAATLSRDNWEKNRAYIKKNGIVSFWHYLQAEMNPHYADYNLWVRQQRVSRKAWLKQRSWKFSYMPKVSVVIPLYNTPVKYLKELMDSLLGQSYRKIQICLADGSTEDQAECFIRKKYGSNPCVVYRRLTENRGISENTNEALKLADGDFIMLADHDDLLEKNAVFEIVRALNQAKDTDIVYTDEDKITMDGRNYFDPAFKPDFNLDFLRSSNYICHIFAVRKEIIDEIGGFRSEFDGAQDLDLILRCCEKARRIVHVPKVLYHWRAHPASTAENPDSKQYAFEAGRKALMEHYRRTGLEAEVQCTKVFGRYRTVFPMKGEPMVSILIPNKDHAGDLGKCLESVIQKTTYRNYEILILENNSQEPETFSYYEEVCRKYPQVKIIYWKDDFNYAAINNFGEKNASGEYLVFLNNDVELITPEWLEEMLGYCQREDVGAVGVRLYYPDDTIQHAGVIIGLGGIAGHIFSGTPRKEYGYTARIISTQDLSAVTAACMMTPRKLFRSVGGFDETFQVAFNDIDYCMKVREKDQLVVYDPYVELYHYESKSRGKEETAEKMKRFHGEIQRFKRKWPDILRQGDPYYNPNLSLKDGNCMLRTNEERSAKLV